MERLTSQNPSNFSEIVNQENVDPRIADVEALARWLDYAFVLPGGFRFGIAGSIGLTGHALGWLLSIDLIHEERMNQNGSCDQNA